MRTALRTVWHLFYESLRNWHANRAPELAAALSFYAAFSLAPLLVLVLAILGMLLGEQAAQGQLVRHIEWATGPTGAEAIQDLLKHARQTGPGLAGAIVSVVALLLGATGFFAQVQDAINRVWGAVPGIPSRGIRRELRSRAISFVMVVAVAVTLLLALAVSAGLSAIGERLFDTESLRVARYLNVAISFAIVAVLLALVYKLLPDARIRWRDVWVGAVGTALLFTAGKFALGLYLGRGAFSSAFGAAGSFAVLLVWMYFTALIVLYGAQFIKTFADMCGSAAAAPHGGT